MAIKRDIVEIAREGLIPIVRGSVLRVLILSPSISSMSLIISRENVESTMREKRTNNVWYWRASTPISEADPKRMVLPQR